MKRIVTSLLAAAAFAIFGLAAPASAQNFDPAKDCHDLTVVQPAGDGYVNVFVLLPEKAFRVPDGKTLTFTIDTQINPADVRNDGKSFRAAQECKFASNTFAWLNIGDISGGGTFVYKDVDYFQAVIALKKADVDAKTRLRTKIGPDRFIGEWAKDGDQDVVVLTLLRPGTPAK
jgi:hypothetical protein